MWGRPGSDVSVPCDQPHTAQAVTYLEPSLNTAGLREQCRAAVMDWLADDARTSRARIAYRDILVEVQAPWRKSGVRCDVVRVAFSGVGDDWIPAVLTGSAKGSLAAAPADVGPVPTPGLIPVCGQRGLQELGQARRRVPVRCQDQGGVPVRQGLKGC